jgi:tetraacyldisaccharide 4'-kinase
MDLLLVPLSWLYGLAVRGRNFCYDRGLLPVAKLGVPVISVGNLSAGGTGKTPIVEYIVRYFLGQQRKVAVVSRGYKRTSTGTFVVSDGTQLFGSAAQAGDEPFQLSRSHPQATVVVDEQRSRGARAAIARSHPDVVILDDAFQHRAIARDLDILVLDSTVPLTAMRLLPAGLRREPLTSAKRAGLIAFSRAIPSPEFRTTIASLSAAPAVCIRFVPTGVGELGSPSVLPAASLRGKRSLAFCGIGNPGSFQATLEEAGAVVLELITFADHHPYTADDLGRIAAAAQRCGAERIVTTEKDAVRLGGEPRLGGLPVTFVRIRAELCQGGETFHRLLDATLRGAQ